MKITGVRMQLYEIPLGRRLGDSNGPQGRDRMSSLALYVDTDEGLSGVSIASPAARASIQSLVNGLLLGRDPRGVRGLWKNMMDAAFKAGNRGIAGDALSALDVALWDLKAKINGEPLWKTLGASSRYVRAYASGLDTPLSNEEFPRIL